MPGLVPGIHVFPQVEGVDGRDKPGHDGEDLTLRMELGVILPILRIVPASEAREALPFRPCPHNCQRGAYKILYPPGNL